MNKIKISDTEILYCLNEEWDNSIQMGYGEIWLTTKAFKRKLEERGIVMVWQSLAVRLHDYLEKGKVERIKTSAGECWKPLGEYII